MSKLVLVFLVIALMVAVVVKPAAGALDVDGIFVSQSKSFWDGTAESSPYDFDVWINGSGITSVSMLDPHSVSHVLSDSGGGRWGFEAGHFVTLAALDANYGPGDYVFTLNGGADSVTVAYAYTEPTDFANVSYPTDSQTNVELNPVYAWDSADGYGTLLTLSIEDPNGLAPNPYSEAPVSDTLTSWQPGPLAGDTAYEFQIAVSKVQDDTPQEMSTVGEDDFTYYRLFDYVNRVGFETVPEIPGDADGDGDVDGVDFGIWQANYPTASGATWGSGDLDNDGDVDGVDFGIWQAAYPTAAPAPVAGSTSVPEPATLGLLIMGGLALLRRKNS